MGESVKTAIAKIAITLIACLLLFVWLLVSSVQSFLFHTVKLPWGRFALTTFAKLITQLNNSHSNTI